MRSQLGPKAAHLVFPLLKGVIARERKRQYGWSDVVFGLTTLPLPLDREAGSSERTLDPLFQLLTDHSEHLQLPSTRCYLLLQRTLRHADGRHRLHRHAFGEQFRQESRQLREWGVPRAGDLQTGIEVLAPGLAPGWEGQAEAQEGVGIEALGQGDRQSAPSQRPFPHAGHITVAGETDLSGLGEPEADPSRLGLVR